MADENGRGGCANTIAYLLVGFLVLMLVLSFFKGGRDDLPADAEAQVAGISDACPIVPMSPVEIETIVSAYEANEAAAQKTYGGRCLLVLGTIAEIDLDMLDEPVIRLAGEDIARPTVRLLDEASEQATFLTKGEETHFLCNEVSEFLGTPTLDGCLVVDPKPSPTP